MKLSLKKLSTLLITGIFAFTIAACSEGPAEEAGEKLDEIAEDTGNAVEDACEDVKEATEAKDKDC
jgi:hypothetical protein